MAQKKSLIGSGEYSRVYENMRGVNFSDRNADATKRFAHLENMYVDYEGGGELESIPGYRTLYDFGCKINGIFSQTNGGEEFLLVHAGVYLYRFNVKERDSLKSPTPIFSGLSDSKSSAVSFGGFVYILDGTSIIAVNADGAALRCGDVGAEPYIPTTHINGAPLEPRNLLTPKFIQKLRLKQADEHAFGTKGIEYAITNYDGKICAVHSISDTVYGDVYVPSFATIGGVRYKVTRILDSAFAGNTRITAVITGANLEAIGNAAFAGCTALTRAIISRTVKTVGSECFKECESLNFLHLGESVQKIGSQAFQLCPSLKEVLYAKGLDEFELIENTAVFEDRPIVYNVPHKHIRMSIPVEGRIDNISNVTFDDTSVSFSFVTGDDSVTVDHPNRELVEGREVTVCGEFATEDGVTSAASGKLLTPEECIFGCTVATKFDERIFISGNPRLPGIVFYSGHSGNNTSHPFYFSAGGYISDGGGGSDVTALLSRGDGLFVFKRGDDGEGNIFFHTAEGEAAERQYPISYIHKCRGNIGAAISFMGDPIFISTLGVCTPKRDVTRDFIGISCRSENIAKPLSAEPLSDIRLDEWRGYLVVSSGGRIYLGDSRSSYSTGDDIAYEWYFLNGIGGYLSDTTVYRYSQTAKNGHSLSSRPDERVSSIVYSVGNSDGGYDYYTNENGKTVSVYPTEERKGGEFFPATEIKCLGDLFFFGTKCGILCAFNNDKRGVIPPHLSASDFAESEYGRVMGRSIHPYYYSFASHAIPYAIATASDNCELPYLEKNTARSSSILNLKCPAGCDAYVSVNTDGMNRPVGRILTSRPDFSDFNFAGLTLQATDYFTVVMSEQEKHWLEKRYFITAQGFRAPLGFCSLAYRYKIKGKIKNR